MYIVQAEIKELGGSLFALEKYAQFSAFTTSNTFKYLYIQANTQNTIFLTAVLAVFMCDKRQMMIAAGSKGQTMYACCLLSTQL